jgi:hypothetical protein
MYLNTFNTTILLYNDSRLRQGRPVHQAVIGAGFILVVMLGGFPWLDFHYSASLSVTAMSLAIQNESELANQATWFPLLS